MTHKQVLFGSGARETILRGVGALADAVRVTLGPKSKCASLLLLTEATLTEVLKAKDEGKMSAGLE